MPLNQYQKVVKFEEVDKGQIRNVLDQLLHRFGLEIIEESTPDYTSYEIREREDAIPGTSGTDSEFKKQFKEFVTALGNGKLIEAIKAHRTITGDGLKEAKDDVERIREAMKR